MSNTRPKALYVALAMLLVALGAIQYNLAPIHAKIVEDATPRGADKSGDMMVQLPSQFMVATLTGFREVVAGLLWVRADEFFHTGQYQAIIPIVRMVTWLDPHQIDVYTTGAWHLAYNFVDENQQSDKRYIPPAIALLREGIRNNPNIWDLYFELGWTHYNKKLMDYESGLKWIEKACQYPAVDPNTGKKMPRPEYVDRMLAHQYEKVGDLDAAVRQWKKTRAATAKAIEEQRNLRDRTLRFINQGSLDVCDRNLAMLLLRKAWRYGDMEAYREGVEIVTRLASRENNPAIEPWAAEGAKKDYERRVANNDPPADALKPLNAGFEVSWKRVHPRVIRVSGKVNLVPAEEYKGLASEVFTHWYQDNEKADADRKVKWRDGSRVSWMLTDLGYEMPDLNDFNWRIDTDQTVAWGSIYVGGGAFSDVLDFSVSEEFYPLKADKYKLTVWLTPEVGGLIGGCPDFIQDRIGWRGEALVDDPEVLDTTSKPGVKMLKKEFIIDREDII